MASMLAGCNVFRTIGTGALLSLRAGLSSSRGCQVFCFCRSDKHSSVGPVRRWLRSGKGPDPSPGRGTSGTLYVSLDSGQLERFWGEDITPKLFHHIATTSQRHQRSARPAPVDQYAPGGPGRQPCGMDLRRGAPLALASYLLGPVLALQLQGTPDANGPYVTGQFVDGIILPNQGGNGLDYRAVHSWR